MNCFTFIGNVTRDLELGTTARGTPTVTYVVAVDRVRIVDDKRVDETDFFPVTTYGRQAENDAKYLRRGSLVGITCEVHSWFNPEQRRGGYNFEPVKVDYLSKSNGAPASRESSAPPAAEDDWLREYDQAERAGRDR